MRQDDGYIPRLMPRSDVVMTIFPGGEMSLRSKGEMDRHRDKRQTKCQVWITEIDETAASGVNADQNRVKVKSGVDTLSTFSLDEGRKQDEERRPVCMSGR